MYIALQADLHIPCLYFNFLRSTFTRRQLTVQGHMKKETGGLRGHVECNFVFCVSEHIFVGLL